MRRVLVVCPPHLLDGWRDQVNQILPGATVRILQRVSDVDAAAAEPTDDGDGRPRFRLTIMVLAAKWRSWVTPGDWRTGNTCPVCGSPPLNSPQKAADAHEWCEHILAAQTTPGRLAEHWRRVCRSCRKSQPRGRYLSRYARKLDAAIAQSNDPPRRARLFIAPAWAWAMTACA